MNIYDTELVKSILKENHYEITTNEESADVVMLNTCSIRDNADRKVYNRIHEIKNKRSNHPVLIGILGCMATNFKTELLENKKLGIDFIAGPDSYKQLPLLISESQLGKKIFDVTLSEFETYAEIYPSREEGINAWIAIMRGCNNFCTFCVVPYTRGRERSRDPETVISEVKRLVSEGFKQITLLGQNVNSYRYENNDFTDLIQKVSDVQGVQRIRFTSPHPKDFPEKLLKIMSEKTNICKQIHLPLQAGSNRILHKMNRTYTKEEFLNLVKMIRTYMPNVALSTDIIVGFPSETKEEFQETLDVVQEVQFDTAFMFKYSERPNTRASQKFTDDISDIEKTDRIGKLIQLQTDITLKKNKNRIDQIDMVMVEAKRGKGKESGFISRNDANILVHLPQDRPYKIGDILSVKITDASPHALYGMPL